MRYIAYILFVLICVPFFWLSGIILRYKDIGFPLNIPIWILITIFTILDFTIITWISKAVEH